MQFFHIEHMFSIFNINLCLIQSFWLALLFWGIANNKLNTEIFLLAALAQAFPTIDKPIFS